MSEPDAGKSPWPPKAYANPDFLNSPSAREIRILCELTEPKHRLRQHKIENTIIFFGSARIPDTETAAQRLQAAKAALEKDPDRDALQASLRTAERLHRSAPYHDMARELARQLAEWSLGIENERERFYICTGGGPGMMEAGNHGASLAGAKSVGLGISLPFEPEHNAYIPDDLCFEFHYFMVRKYWFAYTAKAMVVCPGGFGTMDEFFELLTLIQTHKTVKYVPTVLLGSAFWNDVMNFQAFVDWGVISEDDLKLFRIYDDVDAARNWLVDELTRHYLRPKCQQPAPFEDIPPAEGT